MEEFKGDVSVEAGEAAQSASSTHTNVDQELQALEHGLQQQNVKGLLAKTIRILKAVVKGGIEVPETRKQALSHPYWGHFFGAEEVELNSFSDLKVWELVQKPKGANVVGTRWVYDVKLDSSGAVQRYKARLVAQGFSQKKGIDYNETFAPTMHIKTMRILLALAARDNLRAYQYDISTAFLHASLSEEVYVRQPPGHVVKGKENWVYKLRKAMYGLKNAPKAFSDHFMSVLKRLGFTQSTRDSCLWSYKLGKYYAHYLFHVDDILCVSNSDALRSALFRKLEKHFKIKDEGEISKFLGIRITRLEDGSFTLDQQSYIEKVAKKFGVSEESKPVCTPSTHGAKLSKEMLPQNAAEKEAAQNLPYQELLGCLIYATKTRPDACFAISDCARFMSNWGKQHFKSAMKILRYLYSTRTRKILYASSASEGRPPGACIISAYVDANYGDERDGGGSGDDDKWKSQGGYLVHLGSALVSWRSRRHASRTLSSMEAEYQEACEAAKEVRFLQQLLDELGVEHERCAVLYEDNQACIAFCKNNTCHDRTKHIDVKAHWLRDLVREGVIEMRHVETKQQLADMMTKAQLNYTFLEHADLLFAGTPHPRTSTRARACHARARQRCGCLSCFVCK